MQLWAHEGTWHVPGTVIQILCSHEFFSVIEIIMYSDKN